MAEHRVVITGLGVICPNAHGKDSFAAALRAGKSGIRFFPELRDLKFGCQVGGSPENLEELKKHYFREDLRMSMVTDVVPLGCIAAIDAWKDAGFEVPDPMSDTVDWDTGTIFGTGGGGIDLGVKVGADVNAGKVRRLGSTVAEQVMMSGVSARISGLLALGGPVSTNSSACSTGTEAITLGFEAIRGGRVKRMVAGSADASGPINWGQFDAMRVLASNRNQEPEKASRPMSASSTGFIPGAGAGALVLESLDSARARGARIYAEILSGYLNCGGHRQGGSMTAPNAHGVQKCIRAAIEAAKIQASEIDFINGHLTGTMADPREINNWQQALDRKGDRFPWVNSTKSLIGHNLGAAGSVESVGAVLQLTGGFVHGSLNCEDLHPEIQPIASRVPHQTIEADIRVVAKASFGFGDVNSVIILRKWAG